MILHPCGHLYKTILYRPRVHYSIIIILLYIIIIIYIIDNPYGDCGDPWYSCGKTKPACSSCPDGFTTLASGATSSVQCNVPLVPSLEPTHLPSHEPVVPPTSPSPTLAPTSKTTAAMKPTKTKRKKRKKNYVYLTHSPSRKPTTKTSKGKN